jgi:NAD(P)-dependent dehydrogenase (short-subunit alcohol dehydrogenase family)
MTELKDQVAVVTGSTRGIGEAIARRLAAMGATVALTARDAAQIDRVRLAIAATGGTAAGFPCDLLDAGSVAALGSQIEQRFGRCDILVNNAGVGVIGKPLHETSLEDWVRQMQTNLRGPYLTIKAFAPMMIAARRGHIVNISSLAAKNPLPNGAAYAASKWGLNGLTYSVAEELRSYNVRVSLLAPGSVNTGFGGSGDSHDARKLQPEDVAHVVAMLVTQAPQSFVSEVLLRPTQKA